jgi:hypothetical protein
MIKKQLYNDNNFYIIIVFYIEKNLLGEISKRLFLIFLKNNYS